VGEFPLLKSLKEQLGDKGLALVGVSIDTACDRARETVQRHGLSWPQVCEGKALHGQVPHLFNVDVTPTYYVIDRQGVIVGRKVEANEIRGLVEKALAAETPAKPAAR
jgi:peroxiredoxin